MPATVEKNSNGQLLIDYIGGPEVISFFEQPQAVSTGVVDLCDVPIGFYENFVPEGACFHLTDMTEAEQREIGFYNWLDGLHRENLNTVFLGRGNTNQPFYFFANWLVEDPRTDFVGHKMGADPLWLPPEEALGAVPVSISCNELYTSIERGVIDGYGWLSSSACDSSYPEVTQYMINHGFYPASNRSVLVNLDTFNNLPADLQDVLVDSMIELEAAKWEWGAAEDARGIKCYRDAGVEFIEFSPADAGWYLTTINEAAWEMMARLNPPDVVEQARALLPR